MNTVQVKALSAGLLLLFIFLFGFWLSRSGKPYPVLIFTIHKLIAVAAVIYLGVTLYRIHQAAPLSSLQLVLTALTAVLFVATIVSGGLLSIEKPLPEIVLRLHQVTPYLTAVATAVMLYVVLMEKAVATGV
jgi:hypothetical protein